MYAQFILSDGIEFYNLFSEFDVSIDRLFSQKFVSLF